MKLLKGFVPFALVCGAILSLAGCGGTSNQTASQPTVTAVALAPASTSLTPGKTQALTVTASLSSGGTLPVTAGVTYTSDNTNVATVSATGIVTAGNTAGTAHISATVVVDVNTTLNAPAVAIVVTIPPPTLSSIALSPLTANVAAGATQQLTVTGTYSDKTTKALPASGESFTSMNTGVATVDASGLVTVAAGATVGATATIVATDTASGLATSTASSTVITVAAPPTVSTGVLSTGFNSNGTTTTSVAAATGLYSVYSGGANNPASGNGGGYVDQGTAANASFEYVYVQDTAANLAGYTYQGIGIQPATGQAVSTAGFNSIGFTLAVNPEWLAAGSPNFVVLIAGKVTGVSNPTCNPSVAAVVTATASTKTAYTVPLSAFTKITQNCGVASVTAAQILAAPITEVDFQADGGGAAITAGGLTSNTNTTVTLAGSSPATYPTTINVVGTVAFVTAAPPPAATLVSIALSPLTASVVPGATQQLTVTGTYSDNSTKTLATSGETFTSMNTAVATVSASGLVTVAAGATAGATATIVATDTASGLSSSTANSTVITVAAPPVASTGVLSTGFNSNGTTTTPTAAMGTYSTYHGGANNPAGGNGGGYVDQGTAANASFEYVYVQDTAANLAGYTYQGIGIQPATGQTVSTTGFNSIGFTLAVNPEWLAAGSPKFVVLIAGKVTGVSNATCNPSVAAVVTATAASATAYTVPLTAFTQITQNCGVASVTVAQILAAPITEVDFQADGGGAAITAGGLTSNTNTTVTLAGSSPATYPTTVNVVGTVAFVNSSIVPPPATSTGVLSTGFNSNGTTTTSGTAMGTYSTYHGGGNNPAGGSGGGYVDQGTAANASFEYVYVQDTAANLAGYTYQGVGIQPATGQTVSTTGFNHLSFTLAVNPEWLAAGSPNFVVLIAGKVTGVSNATCNPSVAAVVTATAASATAYTVPLTAFTQITQNCGVASVTAAQILAAPITGVDFQADGGGAAITAGGLTSNTNTTVAAANSSPATYPTTVNVVGGVSFVP